MNIYIKTTPAFDEKAEKLLSKEALNDFFDHIGQNPEAGKVITGTGGIRKIRDGSKSAVFSEHWA